ncbi:type VI secretion system TssO [Cyclobacterium plantarum]|uniref:Type VI secretion system transmembrane protein TssO n=1 Tax=Cyclobacterium plantarum TaxID=2716263 RepID=A0ABX0H993_9BACT|nr:type VI secretion system TssO [Cyclobacterium plantarum]NHE58470.1 type VI secretion system transmembrane protein TssO [Cyclobacterium plantarum]
MKNVLNARERNRALIVFVLSFIVTVSLIVAAVFFYTLIPADENALLREKIQDLEIQIHEQQPFIVAMEEIQYLTDSLQEIGDINPLVKSDIEQHLRIMDQHLQKDGEIFGRINTDIFNFLYDYMVMNEQFIGLKDRLSRVEYLEEELRSSKDKIDELNRDLDFLRKSGNLSVR